MIMRNDMMSEKTKRKDIKTIELDFEQESPELQALYAFYMEFVSKRIADLCIANNLTETEVSRSIGGNKSYLQAITSKKSFPSMRRLINICEYFGITLEEFFSQDKLTPERVKLKNLLSDLSEDDIELLIAIIEKWAIK